MKKTILLALVAIFTFTSCNGEEIGRCELTKEQEQEQIIPYNKGQSVSFTDEAGQAIDLIVTESRLDWLTARDDSRRDYYTYRRKYVVLKSEPNNLKISLKLYADGCLSREDYNSFTVGVNHLGRGMGAYSFYFDAEGNFKTSNRTFFHESIEINGKIYYDVLEQGSLFYNQTYGILQINRGGENFLTLIPETDENKSGMQKSVALDDEDADNQPPANDGKDNNNIEMLKSLELAAESIDIQAIDFEVYPNPNDGSFTVKLSGEIVPYTLEILDQAGRLIETIRGKEEIVNINRSHLITGTYVIKITMNGRTAVKNMIVW